VDYILAQFGSSHCVFVVVLFVFCYVAIQHSKYFDYLHHGSQTYLDVWAAWIIGSVLPAVAKCWYCYSRDVCPSVTVWYCIKTNNMIVQRL